MLARLHSVVQGAGAAYEDFQFPRVFQVRLQIKALRSRGETLLCMPGAVCLPAASGQPAHQSLKLLLCSVWFMKQACSRHHLSTASLLACRQHQARLPLELLLCCACHLDNNAALSRTMRPGFHSCAKLVVPSADLAARVRAAAAQLCHHGPVQLLPGCGQGPALHPGSRRPRSQVKSASAYVGLLQPEHGKGHC